ncbi:MULTISPECIES: ABC transporter ATP-binding protein [Pseudonocardia]|uniref:Iron import ATP-binding/permease protein IrtA n=1 Tax=Pseudonocardia autotrophica TaxID=2074 RepID=A0A1Y2N1R3_PSEAH|nr:MULTISPECIES: ABC transporter ATP-binding protein [Pseudonocardia]OSY40828.1 Iron import ATP-binding/permease protein IrtA [Pseudonocardia autotrophica]TDN71864.1 ATP-binding cassette subfamily B protein [Pseudonocardia autotrophica]
MSGTVTSPAPAVDLFAPVRSRIGAIVGLAAVGAAGTVVPLVAVVELARTLWPAVEGLPVDTGRVWAIVAVAAVALPASFAATWGSIMVGHLADARLQRDVRTRLLDLLGRLPLGWFGRRSSGSVKKTVENDVSALHHITGHAVHDLVVAVVVPVLSLVYLFATEWRMALACLVPLVLTIVLYAAMMAGSRDQLVRYDESVERLNSATVEFVHGIAVVKSFGQGRRRHAGYATETDRFLRFYRGWMGETATMQTLVEVVTAPAVVLAWLAGSGAWLVGTGTVAPVDVLPALVLGLGLTAPLLQLGYTGQSMRGALQARDSVVRFLQQPVQPQPDRPVQPVGSVVEYAGVSFGYDDTRRVLHDISLTCRPGTVTALVGPSGSGKSTLARLLPRFHDVDDGRISVGGADVRDVATAALYAEIGFVLQDAHVLRTTVRDNIRLTRPDADDEQVEQAAVAARIHDRILRLPRGYDSVIGADAHLSGGEQQRLTIARALVTDAPILVLDEATAALDPDSEAAVQDAVSALAVERSLLVIAHRLHTVTGADTILVLDGGRITERGTHDELLSACGTYRDLWVRQERVRERSPEPVVSGEPGAAGVNR